MLQYNERRRSYEEATEIIRKSNIFNDSVLWKNDCFSACWGRLKDPGEYCSDMSLGVLKVAYK